MTAAQFGEKLRHHRERHGVSLETIATATKIGRRLLIALENGDCSRWPGGIYARSYFRSYARAIGLNDDELVTDFCEAFPQFARPEPTDPPPIAEATVSARPSRLAQLRDLFHRGEGRFDLFFGVERSK